MSIDWTPAITATIGVVLGGSGVWGFINWWLRKHIEERYSKAAQRDIEQFKHELNQHGERMKYDLQRDMLKAQLSTTKTHKVYPAALEALRIAEGAIRGLIFSSDPTYEDYNDKDFAAVFERVRIPDGERAKLLDKIHGDRRRGTKALEETLRRVRIGEAMRAAQEAKNIVYLKALYISIPVRTSALEVVGRLLHVAIDFQCETNTLKTHGELDAASSMLEDLEKMMRDELQPTTASSETTPSQST